MDPSDDAETTTPLVSIVVPAYNEATRLPDTLDAILALADFDTEVIFVDDGSSDSTRELLEARTGHLPNATVVGSPTNRGKGAAVRLGMARASGRSLVFMDADLATDLDSLDPLVGSLAHHHVAIGSRSVAGTVVVDSSAGRRRMGGVFNRLARSLTGVPFEDTQCGFKAFQAPMGKLLFALSRVDGFAFDVEVLALASAMDATVHELPIRWREVDGSHVRPLSDAVRMSVDVARARRTRSVTSDRVCGMHFPCGPGEQTELAAEVVRHVRHFDIVSEAPGRVDVVAPFVRPEHVRDVVERVTLKAGLDPASVEVATLDANAVAGLVMASRSRGTDAVWPRSMHDHPRPSLTAVATLDESLI